MEKVLESLLSAFGVSGHEEEVRSVICDELNRIGAYHEVDKMGNVIVKVGKKLEEENRFMLSAHMDTMGVIVTYIDDKGFARIGKVGEFKETAMINTIVEFENGNSGRVCAAKEDPRIEDLYIDLGVDNREEALELIEEGDVAVFTSNIIEERNNIIAPFLENRIGCYMMLKLIEDLLRDREAISNLDKELLFVFSTQNKVGGRGGRAAAYSLNPSYCIVIDGEEATDNLGGKGNFKIGSGLGIKFMDRTLIMHHEIKELLENAFNELQIKPHYIFTEKGGDGATIHKEGHGIKTGTLVFPVRYKDTNLEMVNNKDIETGIQVLRKVIDSFF